MKISIVALLLALGVTVAAQESTTFTISGVLPTPTNPMSFQSHQSASASSVASAASSVESAVSAAASSFGSAASSIISSVSSVAHTATAGAGSATGLSVEGVLVGAFAGAVAAFL